MSVILTQKRLKRDYVDESTIKISELPEVWTAGHLAFSNLCRLPGV